MSHFATLVILPCEYLEDDPMGSLSEVLEPYNENTDNPNCLVFSDYTGEAAESYKTEKIPVVEYPDGRIVTTVDHEFRKHYEIKEDKICLVNPKENNENVVPAEQMKLIKDYPVSKFFSFEEYCSDQYGYVNENGRWGYFGNPNAQWDWYSIGGRFSGNFRVRNGNTAGTESDIVDIARMSDILWPKMKEDAIAAARRRYAKFVHAAETRDLSGFDDFTHFADNGDIMGWSATLYKVGETEEEFLMRQGLGNDDKFMVGCYAVIDRNGEWHSSGDMGWFGLSSNDKPERQWNDEIQRLVGEAEPDDVLVMVDCHI